MQIIGVAFKEGGKIYDFITQIEGLALGQGVIVDTVRGAEYGYVQTQPRPVREEDVERYKPVLRVATPEDDRQMVSLRARKQQVLDLCQKKIIEKKLEMQLVDVEIGFETGRITVYFTADGRVDFREMVRELSGVLRARIELRQIGARDEARMLGGLGSCGRALCCSTFLPDFQPVSIKMAKEQGLSLSPTKISGLCSRLMCCLKYEQEHYEMLRKQMPKVGREVTTPDGRATVTELHVLTGTVGTKRLQPDGDVVVKDYPVEQLQWARGEAKAETKETAEKPEEATAADSTWQESRQSRQRKKNPESQWDQLPESAPPPAAEQQQAPAHAEAQPAPKANHNHHNRGRGRENNRPADRQAHPGEQGERRDRPARTGRRPQTGHMGEGQTPPDRPQPPA